jgi:hypothetical protein
MAATSMIAASCLHAKIRKRLEERYRLNRKVAAGKLRGYPPRNPDSRPPDYKGLLEFDRLVCYGPLLARLPNV